MDDSKKLLAIDHEIILLRQKLDTILGKSQPMNCGKVLEVSEKLDELIVGYYNTKNASKEC